MTIKEENVLLSLFFLAPFIARKFYRKEFLIVASFVVCILLPYLLGNLLFHIKSGSENYLMRYAFWKQGSLLSFDFFKNTISHNLYFFLNWDYTFLIIILLNILGIFFMFKKSRKLSLMFLFWLFVIPALFSAYIGEPLEFSEVRHYIPVLLSIVVFSSYGAVHLCKSHFFEKIKLFHVITTIILVSGFFTSLI